MKISYVQVLVLAFLPLLLRVVLYWGALRVRHVRIRLVQCVILAGAPYLIGVVPLPLPQIVTLILTLFLASFLLMRYTDAELFPDGILIPFSVEVASSLIITFAITPLIR